METSEAPTRFVLWEVIATGIFVRSPIQISGTGIFFSVSICMVRRCPALGRVRQFTKGNTKDAVTVFF